MTALDSPVSRSDSTPETAGAGLERRARGAPYLFGAGLGFFTLGIQVLVAREVLATFFGTELLLSLFFTAWLASFGLGSWMVRGRGGSSTLCVMTLVLGLLPQWTVAAVRASPAALGLTPGEAVPWWVGVVGPLVALVPIGVVAGALFPLGARFIHDSARLGRFYAAEAAGGLLAGLATSFWLNDLDTLRALVPLTACFAGASVVLMRQITTRRVLFRLGAVAVLLHAMAWSSRGPALERMRWQALVGEGDLLWSGDSRYGHLQVADFGQGTAFYFDSRLLFSCPPDPLELLEAATMLLVPPSLHTVGVAGHPSPPLLAVMPETTEVVTVQEDHLLAAVTARVCGAARGTIADPRAWLSSGLPLDLLVVYTPEPLTAVANRYYTRDFFAAAARRLSPAGVLALPAHLPATLLSGSQASVAAGTYHDLRDVFASVIVSPGPGGWFFASRDAALTRESVRQRAAGREDGGRSAAYVNLMFPSEETAELTGALALEARPAPNTDRHPRAFVRQMHVWLERSGFRSAAPMPSGAGRAGAVLILSLVAAWLWWRRTHTDSRTKGTISTTGFASFAGSLLVLLGFQHAVGTLYHRIAVLNSFYMAGLVVGSWAGSRRPVALWVPDVALVTVLALSAAIVPVVRDPWVYYAITTAVAGAAGVQFASAGRLLGTGREPQHTAAILEWFDRLGACAGGLTAGLVLLPLFGFAGGFLILAAIKALSAVDNTALLVRGTLRGRT